MRYMMAVALALALAACAGRPGYGVTPTVAQQWGCQYDRVQAMAAAVSEDLPTGQVYIPQVGWTACELLARRGTPNRVDRQQSASGRSATWWYGSSRNLTMVRLRQDGRQWRVVYVGS